MYVYKFIWLVLGFCFLAVTSVVAGPNWLITPEEAVSLRTVTDDFKELAAVVVGPGPQIIVKDPKVLERLTSPINIFIAFEPGRSGLEPDMNTLKVTLIGFINLNITNRVREYVNRSNLDIKEADLPVGRHKLRMAIKDMKGNSNERDVVVTVLAK